MQLADDVKVLVHVDIIQTGLTKHRKVAFSFGFFVTGRRFDQYEFFLITNRFFEMVFHIVESTLYGRAGFDCFYSFDNLGREVFHFRTFLQ